MIQLREYQQKIIDSLRVSIRNGNKRLIFKIFFVYLLCRVVPTNKNFFKALAERKHYP
jgi:hypothetical protein